MNPLKRNHKKQIIAENVQISCEWLEIYLEKPLKPVNRFQKILLSIENFADDYEDHFPVLKLKDGTIINPEIEVVDEIGKTYKLKYSSIHNDMVAFPIPQNTNIKIIRIKSDESFLCEKIIWYDYRLK